MNIERVFKKVINEVTKKSNTGLKVGTFWREEGKKGFKRRFYDIDPKDITEKDKKRFMKFVKLVEDENYEVPHLLWTGWKAYHPRKKVDSEGNIHYTKKRYGMFSFKGKNMKKNVDVRAIRFFWVMVNNKRVPEGKTLNHFCEHSDCVSHAYAGTPSQNLADRHKRKPDPKKFQKRKSKILKYIKKYLNT